MRTAFFNTCDENFLKMEDYVSGEDKLILPSTVVVGRDIVGMIVSKLGPDSDQLVRPPGDADGMFGIRGGKPGATADLVVKIFITHGEEGIT